MLKFYETQAAGRRAEQEVYAALRQYTRHIYQNFRISSMFTKKGETEVDIVAAISDVLLIVEVKNVRSISGSISDSFWKMEGMETGHEYSALNVLTQNRIHVRSLKDLWLAKFDKFPVVISVVVVPNGCVIPDDIREGGVLTVGEFCTQLSSLQIEGTKVRYGYRLDFIGGGNG